MQEIAYYSKKPCKWGHQNPARNKYRGCIQCMKEIHPLFFKKYRAEGRINDSRFEKMDKAFKYKGDKCLDCGLSDRRVLDFDHVPGRGKKSFSVGNSIHRTWAVVEEELEKCDLVCANCHRIRTYNRRMEIQNAKS